MTSVYEIIYNVVRQIPRGKVSTYGKIAQLAGPCTPRMVGYALHALPQDSDVPWQRVVNSKGKISLDPAGIGQLQMKMLEDEGIMFTSQECIDLQRYGWPIQSSQQYFG